MQLGLRTAPAQARTRVTPSRALTVTLGLSAAGAIIGTTIALGSYAALFVGLRWQGYFGPLGFLSLAVIVGAALGALALPLAAWALPHVSLGRIIAITGLGTLLGAHIGLLSTFDPFGAVGGALVGFACGVAWRSMCPRGASAATLRRLGLS